MLRGPDHTVGPLRAARTVVTWQTANIRRDVVWASQRKGTGCRQRPKGSMLKGVHSAGGEKRQTRTWWLTSGGRRDAERTHLGVWGNYIGICVSPPRQRASSDTWTPRPYTLPSPGGRCWGATCGARRTSSTVVAVGRVAREPVVLTRREGRVWRARGRSSGREACRARGGTVAFLRDTRPGSRTIFNDVVATSGGIPSRLDRKRCGRGRDKLWSRRCNESGLGESMGKRYCKFWSAQCEVVPRSRLARESATN